MNVKIGWPPLKGKLINVFSKKGNASIKSKYHAVGDTWWQPLWSYGKSSEFRDWMYRNKDWFIHLLILSIVYEHHKEKTNVF